MIRLIVPLTAALVIAHGAQVFAQSAFPAPLPNQSAAPANASPFPPVNGAAPSAAVGAPSPFPSQGAAPVSGAAFGGAPQPPPAAGGGADACMKGFLPLREDAEKRGKLIKAASDRKASPEEACKLIGNFSQAEVKMLKYIEANATKCGVPPQVSEQMKNGHKNTEAMQQKVCGVAQQMAQQKASSAPSLSEVLGSGAMPEATSSKKGGSTFDTLNGNVLSR